MNKISSGDKLYYNNNKYSFRMTNAIFLEMQKMNLKRVYE